MLILIKLIPLQVFFNTWRYEIRVLLSDLVPSLVHVSGRVIVHSQHRQQSVGYSIGLQHREDKTRNPQASSMECLPLHSPKIKTLLVREWIFLKEQSAVLLLLRFSSTAQGICYNDVRLHTTRS